MTTSTQCRRVSFLDIFESLLKLRELTLRNIVRKRIRRAALSNTRFRSRTFRRSGRSRYSQIELAISRGVSRSICLASSWRFRINHRTSRIEGFLKVNKLEPWGQNWSGIHIQNWRQEMQPGQKRRSRAKKTIPVLHFQFMMVTF